jgi:hypothetical protein
MQVYDRNISVNWCGCNDLRIGRKLCRCERGRKKIERDSEFMSRFIHIVVGYATNK